MRIIGTIARNINAVRTPVCLSAKLSPALIFFLAGSHDIGKIFFSFQAKNSVWLKQHGWINIPDLLNGVKHGQVTASVLSHFLKQKTATSSLSAAKWAVAIGGHHGYLPAKASGSPISVQGENKLLDWPALRHDALEELWRFGNCGEIAGLSADEDILWFVAGLTAVADWIGSDETFFPTEKELSIQEIDTLSDKAVEALSFCAPEPKLDLDFRTIFTHGSDVFVPNALQKSAAVFITEPGIYGSAE
ncbi:MAG: CRISPR-associated endonuclease Cas3'' [Desulfovibrio sp.]|nr:CRISPR-associated endonuclease Cas3'' [Desulfovibrio sp.]